MSPADVLRRYPLTDLLSERELREWLAAGRQMTFDAGESLLQAGTPGECAYLIRTGRVRAVRRSETDAELSLGYFVPGDLFGEFAVLPPGLNMATCRATETTVALRLPLAPLREFIAARPDLIRNLKNWLRLHALAAFLRDRCYLGFTAADAVMELHARLEVEEFAAYNTIQSEGLGDDRWYFIDQGGAYVDSVGIDDRPMHDLTSGDCFGAEALLPGRRVPTVVATVDTKCLSLARDVFDPPRDPAALASRQSVNTRRFNAPQRFAWIGQRGAADCGIAAVAMVFGLLGLDAAAAAIRAGTVSQARGLSMLELRDRAGQAGIRCEAVRVAADQVRRLALPVVAHLSNDHYVAVFEIDAGRVTIGDPETGVVTLALAEFAARMSGCFLTFPASRQENR